MLRRYGLADVLACQTARASEGATDSQTRRRFDTRFDTSSNANALRSGRALDHATSGVAGARFVSRYDARSRATSPARGVNTGYDHALSPTTDPPELRGDVLSEVAAQAFASANRNVAIGSNALLVNTQGNENVATGFQALQAKVCHSRATRAGG